MVVLMSVRREAFKMTPSKRKVDSHTKWPMWMRDAFDKDRSEIGSLKGINHPKSDGRDNLSLRTSEGLKRVEWGQWVIRESSGELSVCNRHDFERKFEQSN